MQEFPVYKKLFVKTSRVSSIQETFAMYEIRINLPLIGKKGRIKEVII